MNALILVALLIIPSLNVRVPIYFAPYYEKTWDISHIGSSVGLLEGSAYPDEYGNTVLAGHYAVPPALTDGPFMRLSELDKGDIIQILHNGIVYEYEVDRYFIVGEKSVDITQSTSDKRLTLFTCTQAVATDYRYVVIARFIESREELMPTSTQIAVTPTEHTGQTQTSSPVPTYTHTPVATITPTNTVVPMGKQYQTNPTIYAEKPENYGAVFVLLSTVVAILTGVLAWRNR